MIREFGVKNFLSIRDWQYLSFLSKTKSPYLSVEVAPRVFINKLAIFYGANASGKSNILLAIQTCLNILIRTQADSSTPIISPPPFALTSDEPTEMEISLYIKGGRYDYELSYNKNHIISESLYHYPNGSKSLFYTRTFREEGQQAEIKFGNSLGLRADTKKVLREQTLNNHSVLATCQKVALKEDISPLLDLVREIKEYVITSSSKSVSSLLREAEENKQLKQFYLNMLGKADLNISDFHTIEKQSTSLNRGMDTLDIPSTSQDGQNIVRKSIEAFFTHQSGNETFNISLGLQSLGTLQYIEILDVVYRLITQRGICLMDEVEERLHYDLLLYLLNVFVYNSEGTQLLITSHTRELLSEDLLNEHRDLVWFVEKNSETASSEYYRADTYGLHKNVSLYNSYRIGRLGAVPKLGSFLLENPRAYEQEERTR